MPDSLNRQRLIAIATAMYGPDWQRPLSRELGVKQVQCWRWATGEYEPDDQRVYELEEIARRRMEAITKALRMGRE